MKTLTNELVTGRTQHKSNYLQSPNYSNMCLVGRLNPYKLEQSWELTFLIGLTLLNTKLALKNFLTHIL